MNLEQSDTSTAAGRIEGMRLASEVRQIDSMRSWSRWMVRHRLTLVVLALNWTVQPLAFLAHLVFTSLPELWAFQMENHSSIRQAAREARDERARAVEP